MIDKLSRNLDLLRNLSLTVYIGIFVGSLFLFAFTYPASSETFAEFSFEPWLIEGLSSDLYNFLFNNRFSSLVTAWLTICSFGLLVFLLSRHIDLTWSVALALVAMCYIENYPLREFLINIYQSGVPAFVSSQWLAGLNQPVPLVSNFLFLAFASLCYRYRFKPIRFQRATVLILFPILISGLSGIDGFLSLVFGLGFFAARMFRSAGAGRMRLFSFALLAVVSFSVALWAFLDFSKLMTPSPDQYMLSLYKSISIFALPIAGCALVCWIGRLDFNECWVNFSSIILVMLFEATLILGSTIGLINFDLLRLHERTFQVFFHVAYYVPMIYFSERVLLNGAFSKRRLLLSNWQAVRLLLLYAYRILPHCIAWICCGYLLFTTRFFV